MKLPPMVVYKTLFQIESMLTDYLQADCVDAVKVDDRFAVVTFKEVPASVHLTAFLDASVCGIPITFQGHDYVIISQYLP